MRGLAAAAGGALVPVLGAAVTLGLALLLTGALVAALGNDPLVALRALVRGSVGSLAVLNFTLYYATSFTFAALAFAIPFRAGLFSIGAEGQAYLAGLGVAVWCLYLSPPGPLAMIGGAVLLGALPAMAFAALPGWLHATNRGNIVITTIMLNFVVYALMTYLILGYLIRPGQQSPETARFAEAARLLRLSDMLGWVGIEMRAGPASVMVFVAVAVAVLVHLMNRHTLFGARLRVIGLSETASRYAGISPVRHAVLAMVLAGAVASLLAVNEILGVHQRLIQDFVSGYGFVGIAVALMGRGHPLGILPAALLFGALYQGGTELAFEMPGISREVVVLIQGIVVFAVGALQHRVHRSLGAGLRRIGGRRHA